MTSHNQSELPEDDDDAAAVIVQRLKSQGVFDSMRRECLADIDTKPAFLNLSQRIERYVGNFLERQEWRQDLNKNQLRERLRRNLTESNMMKYGVEHLVDGAVQAKKRSFQPEVEKVIKDMLGIEEEEDDWSEERKEPDVDNSQQDMDVDDDSSDGPSVSQGIVVKSDSFIPSFVEVHSSSQSSSSPPTKSIIQQLFDPVVKKEETPLSKVSFDPVFKKEEIPLSKVSFDPVVKKEEIPLSKVSFDPVLKKEGIPLSKVSTPGRISIHLNLGSKQLSPGMADMDIETDEGSSQEQGSDQGREQGFGSDLGREQGFGSDQDRKQGFGSDRGKEGVSDEDSRPSSRESISHIQLPASSPPPLVLIHPKRDSPNVQGISPEEESDDDDDDDIMNIEAQYSPVQRSSTVFKEETESEPEVEVGSDTTRQSLGEKAQIKMEEKSPVRTEVIESEGIKSEGAKSEDIKSEGIKSESTKSEGIKSEGIKSAPKEDIAPVEYLSDVSSVHTSDLSDFDDKSSSEEESAKVTGGKKGKSKKELEEHLVSTESRKRRVSTENIQQSTENIQQSTDSRPSTASSSGRRERKVNPRYASDEFSSIYNRKKNQTIEEDISSDEDFEGGSGSLATPLQDELSGDGSSDASRTNAEEGETSRTEETSRIEEIPMTEERSEAEETSRAPKAEEASEAEETSRAPKAEDSTAASESAASDGQEDGSKSQQRNVRRKTSRRQERYDASDLYKPRPVIGTSRRNRSATNPDQPT